MKRRFELFGEQDISLGVLNYPSWFSLQAEIITPNARYKVIPTGFWRTSIAIFQNTTEIGRLYRQWNGQLTLALENGPTYIFKRVGFFNAHFGLFNENDRELVIVRKHDQLSFFNLRYDIETDDNYFEVNHPFMLLLLIHGVGYFNRAHAMF